jgi:hypothetical protein
VQPRFGGTPPGILPPLSWIALHLLVRQVDIVIEVVEIGFDYFPGERVPKESKDRDALGDLSILASPAILKGRYSLISRLSDLPPSQEHA